MLAGCSHGQRFTVQGTLDDARFSEADSVMISCPAMKAPLQVPVKNKAFSLRGSVEKPAVAKLDAIGAERKDSRLLILEKGTVTFRNGRACGTPLNDSTEAFTERLAGIGKQYAGQKEELRAAVEGAFTDFVARHADDPCAAYAILIGNYRVHPAFLLGLIESVSPEIRNSEQIHPLYTRIKMMTR